MALRIVNLPAKPYKKIAPKKGREKETKLKDQSPGHKQPKRGVPPHRKKGNH